MKTATCTVVSGAMFYLSQGLSDIWILAWFAPVPLLWLAYGNTPSWRVLFATIAAFSAGQIYLVQCYGSSLPVAVLLPIFGALCLLFVAAIFFARVAAKRLPAFAAILAFPAAWTAFEFGLDRLSPHGSFGSLAYAEASFAPAVQIASLFGLYAVTFVLCLGANAVAFLLRHRRGPAWAALGACAAALLFGIVRLNEPQGPRVRVAALADPDARREAHRLRTVDAATEDARVYAAKVRDLAATGVQAGVIAEGAIPFHSAWQTQVIAPLVEAAKQSGMTVIAGTYVPDPPMNRAFAFHPDGSFSIYTKRHLLRPLEVGVAGTSPGLLGGGRAMAICKDLDFPWTIRSDGRNGIRLLIVPAGDFVRDGWIHARMAVMRGVENGCAVLRSAFDGLETVSDANGRLIGSASTSRPGMTVLVAEVPLGPGSTFYDRIGDLLPEGCAVLTLVLAMSIVFPFRPKSQIPGTNANSLRKIGGET